MDDSSLEEIAKRYLRALWLSRDLRRLHSQVRDARQLAALINATVNALPGAMVDATPITEQDIPKLAEIILNRDDAELEAYRKVIEALAPPDFPVQGHGPGHGIGPGDE